MRKPFFPQLENWLNEHEWPQWTIWDDESSILRRAYMTRYYLIPFGDREDERYKGGKNRAWWPFGIKLHKICRSDDDRFLHNHPWASFSIILNGSYNEIRFENNDETTNRTVSKRYYPGNLNIIKSTDFHRLELEEPVWTLFFSGRHVQDWGFWNGEKCIPHSEYMDGVP